MAQWQSKLMLKDIWNKYDSGEMTIQDLSKTIAVRLSKLEPSKDEDIIYPKDEIVNDFECLSGDEAATVEEFDDIMNALYDWGDISLDNKFGGKKVCWIATNF